MKRPFPVIAVSYLLATVFAIHSQNETIIAAAILLAAIFVMLLIVYIIFKFKNMLPLAALSASIALGSFLIFSSTTIAFSNDISETKAEVCGTVTSCQTSSSENEYYIVKADTINGKKAPRAFNIMLFLDQSDEIFEYDKIRVNVKFFKSSISNEDNFNLTDSVVISAISLDEADITNRNEFSLLREICKIRDKMIYKIRSAIPNKESDVLCGILFGKRDYIDAQTKNLFAISGISHILSVSGLHLTILVQILERFLSSIGLGYKSRSVLSIIIMLIIMTMTGFTVAVIRSAIMNLFIIIFRILRQDYDGLTALSIAAVILVIINPYTVENIGFLLSFSATAGLLVSSRLIEEYRLSFSVKTVKVSKMIFYEFMRMVLPCITAYIFTIPVTSYAFSYVSTYSPLTNFLIAPFSSIMLGCIFIGAILSLTSISFLYYPFLYVSNIICSGVIYISQKVAFLPFSKIEVSKEIAALFTILILVLVPLAIYSKRIFRNSFNAAVITVIITCSAFLIDAYFTKPYTKISLKGFDSKALIIEHNNSFYINGYSKDSSYAVKNKILCKENPQILFLSMENASEKDVASLINISNISSPYILSVPDGILATVNSVKDKIKSDKIFLFDSLKVSNNDIKINSFIKDKNKIICYEIEGFKIVYANIESAVDKNLKIDCDLLISNGSALYFTNNFKYKYFILNEKAADENFLKQKLEKRGVVYLGDSTLDEVYIKDSKLYKKRFIF